jgi:hypothetical protein
MQVLTRSDDGCIICVPPRKHGTLISDRGFCTSTVVVLPTPYNCGGSVVLGNPGPTKDKLSTLSGESSPVTTPVTKIELISEYKMRVQMFDSRLKTIGS